MLQDGLLDCLLRAAVCAKRHISSSSICCTNQPEVQQCTPVLQTPGTHKAQKVESTTNERQKIMQHEHISSFL